MTKRSAGSRRSVGSLIAALLACGALCALAASPASAAFGFEALEAHFENEDGSAATQAGSHPFSFTTTLSVNTFFDEEGKEYPEGETKNLFLHQVEGFTGNPTATPPCPTAKFIERVEGASQCPNATAVGIAGVRAGFSAPQASDVGYLHVPVFNLTPPPGVAAKLGFVVLNAPITVEVLVNPDPPHNILAQLENVPQVLLFYGSRFTLWGNPADEAHDPYRGACLGDIAGLTEGPISEGLCPVDIPEKPFITLPRACEGPLETRLLADSWEAPGAFVGDSVLTNDGATPPSPQGMSGCEELRFSPQISARPSTAQAESASGLEFEIAVKDEGIGAPNGTAHSDIRRIEATLPEGLTANPSAAEGLGTCSIAQFGNASLSEKGCPDASKLGTIEVETPVLEDRILRGSVYLAKPDEPATAGKENPFDSLLALYFAIRDPKLGIFVSQAAKVEADPESGRLVTIADRIPQVPLSRISVRLREGPRAPLITPPACGTHTTTARLIPWSGAKAARSSSSFALSSGPGGGPCPPAGARSFAPGFEAGSINNAAGRHSPFFMRLARRDGEQDLTKLSLKLPPGVIGKIAGVPLCADAAIAASGARSARQELAAPSCPAASRIGSVLAGAGVGEALTYVPGSAYLAGPYKGAPLSVAVITPALAGPFDAGVVVVRVGLSLNPIGAEVEVDGSASDPIPHILKGIPLKVRDLRVSIDRPAFTLNPTSCAEFETRARIWGGGADLFSAADDLPFDAAARFQAAGCAALAFSPRLAIKLRGGARRGAHPALRAVVTPRPGQANFARAAVTLPRSAFLEQAHIRTICTRVQFAAAPGHGAQCPPGSIYGRARAWSPLLDAPAQGPVYLRSSTNNLPDLVVALRGPASAPVEVELASRIDSVKGGIRSVFTGIPDIPVSRFILDMQGGKKGLIVNSRHLCHKPKRNRARANLRGQNGKLSRSKPRVISVACQKRRKAKRGGRGAKRRAAKGRGDRR